ncbi:MAG: hypothetical protein PHC90_04835 [Syntrophorhabdaceae bacterium]|nr:hypothetical protein [Syntrophorhabdaceae bacterium]
MKKTFLIVLAFAVLMVTLVPVISDARGRYHRRPHHHYSRGYHYGAGYGLMGMAGGFIAGTIVGSALSRPGPVYVVPPPPPPPPRVYYYYPPPHQVYVYPY